MTQEMQEQIDGLISQLCKKWFMFVKEQNSYIENKREHGALDLTRNVNTWGMFLGQEKQAFNGYVLKFEILLREIIQCRKALRQLGVKDFYADVDKKCRQISPGMGIRLEFPGTKHIDPYPQKNIEVVGPGSLMRFQEIYSTSCSTGPSPEQESIDICVKRYKRALKRWVSPVGCITSIEDGGHGEAIAGTLGFNGIIMGSVMILGSPFTGGSTLPIGIGLLTSGFVCSSLKSQSKLKSKSIKTVIGKTCQDNPVEGWMRGKDGKLIKTKISTKQKD